MPNKTSDLELLHSDAEYYGGVGKKYLSNSDIKTLLENPSAYGTSRPDTLAMLQGRLLHQLLLEPDKAQNFPVVDTATRNNKEYKDYCAKNELEYALLSKEVENITNMATALSKNIFFYEQMYSNGNLYEQPAIGEIDGAMWKGKADIITSEYIIDVKTTSDINKFKYSAKTYNYDSQCYIYQQLFGKPMCFFVVDKETYQIGVFTPSPAFLDGGHQKVLKAIEVYNKYFSENHTDEISDHFIQDTL